MTLLRFTASNEEKQVAMQNGDGNAYILKRSSSSPNGLLYM